MQASSTPAEASSRLDKGEGGVVGESSCGAIPGCYRQNRKAILNELAEIGTFLLKRSVPGRVARWSNDYRSLHRARPGGIPVRRRKCLASQMALVGKPAASSGVPG